MDALWNRLNGLLGNLSVDDEKTAVETIEDLLIGLSDGKPMPSQLDSCMNRETLRFMLHSTLMSLIII